MPETFGKSHAPPAKKVKTQASSGSQVKGAETVATAIRRLNFMPVMAEHLEH
jgi:hypothetical protein